MTTTTSHFDVFQLNENNFENWRIKMKTLLDSKNICMGSHRERLHYARR